MFKSFPCYKVSSNIYSFSNSFFSLLHVSRCCCFGLGANKRVCFLAKIRLFSCCHFSIFDALLIRNSISDNIPMEQDLFAIRELNFLHFYCSGFDPYVQNRGHCADSSTLKIYYLCGLARAFFLCLRASNH